MNMHYSSCMCVCVLGVLCCMSNVMQLQIQMKKKKETCIQRLHLKSRRCSKPDGTSRARAAKLVVARLMEGSEARQGRVEIKLQCPVCCEHAPARRRQCDASPVLAPIRSDHPPLRIRSETKTNQCPRHHPSSLDRSPPCCGHGC
jgi:hypothetical protein